MQAMKMYAAGLMVTLAVLAGVASAGSALVTSVAGTEGTATSISATFKDDCGTDPTANICDPNFQAASIKWGDGSTADANGKVTAGACTTLRNGDRLCSFTISGQHVYTAEGTYTVTITFNDGTLTDTATQTATITEALTAGPTLQPSATTNRQFSGIVGFFSEPGAGLEFSARIDWGDGSAVDSTALVVARKTGIGFEVRGNHTYTTAGSYPITVTVTDLGGVSLLLHNTVVVADPPAAGPPDTVINFDDAPACTDAPAACTDATRRYPDVRFTATGGPATITASLKADTAPNVLTFAAPGELGAPVLTGTFQSLHTFVALRVGLTGGAGLGTAVLRAYDVTGKLIAENAAEVDTTTHTPLSVNAGTARIASFQVTLEPNDWSGYMSIDTLTFGNAAQPVAPDFRISADFVSAKVPVRQGASATTSLTIDRFNGSNGPIQLTASGLPRGVTASFAPNPADGTSTAAALTLTAAPGAPATGPVAITITGTPAGAAVGPATPAHQLALTVQVLAPYTVKTDQAGYDVWPCGTTRVPIHINRDPSHLGAFTGPVRLSVAGVPAGLVAQLSAETLNAPDADATLTLTRGDVIGSADSATVTITATSGPLSEQTTALIGRRAGYVWSVSPKSGDAPARLQPGTTVKILGEGFCPGSRVRFGGAEAPGTVTPGHDGANDTTTATIPRLATTGTLSVLTPGGNEIDASEPFTVRTFRNTNGFAFRNPTKAGDFSFDDATDAFGYAQTHLTIDFCPPFGCNVTLPIPDPLTYAFVAAANSALAGDGACFGMVLTSERLLKRDLAWAPFSPPGAASPFAFDGRDGAAPALAHQVHVNHLEQLSAEFIRYWAYHAAFNIVDMSGASIYSQVHDDLARDGVALVTVEHGGGGHVLEAYDLERNDDGTFWIDVYDPNTPFRPGDENGLSNFDVPSPGDGHVQREHRSRILIHPDGAWDFPGLPGWSGGGIGHALVVAPYGMPPLHPTIPTSLGGLITLLTPSFGSSGTTQPSATQLSDGAGHTLLNADGTQNTNPQTALKDSAVLPDLAGNNGDGHGALVSARPGPLTMTLPTGAGGAITVSPGFAAQVSGLGGARRTVTVNSQSGILGFDGAGAGAITAKLMTRSAGSDADASASITAGGTDTLQLHGGVLSVGGPGRLSITLEAGGGTAAPGTFTLPPLTLGRGDVARIATSSWKHLTGATVTITIRSASGRVRRTTVNNRFAGPHATHVTTAAAVIRGRRTRLTVATSPAGGRAASEVIAWTVLRGNHPVAHHQLTVTRPSHGAHRYVWDWQPSRPGRYRVIADLIVIAPDGSATSAAARPVSFRIAR